jgi:hypothetical protein
MSAAQLPLEIEQGSECVLTVTVVGGPADLTGYVGAMQIREMKSSAEVLYEVSSDNVSFDIGGRIVTVRIPAADTATFDWDRGVYDVLITAGDDSAAWRICEGKVTVDHWVTREGA